MEMSISRGGDYRENRPISIGEPEKVTSWPFKDPEKKSAWKDTEIKDAPITLVDHELEKSKRRTEEIRAQMSPPEKLKLPPLLEAARQKWGIPDGAFAAQAVFDRIHIFPIDFEGEKDTYGTSGIIRAEVTKLKDLQKGHRGVLISMGLSAADQCVSHGVELGHIVTTIRNAPHAMECCRLTTGSLFYLVMRAGDLCGSETQRERLLSGEEQITDDGGDHSYCFNLQGKKKKVALVRDAW